MTLLDRLEQFVHGRRDARLYDVTQGIAIVQSLRAAGGGMARPAAEPCPVCGIGTTAHRHEAKVEPVLAPVRKIGGGR
jgi:hypothetical protein